MPELRKKYYVKDEKGIKVTPSDTWDISYVEATYPYPPKMDVIVEYHVEKNVQAEVEIPTVLYHGVEKIEPELDVPDVTVT